LQLRDRAGTCTLTKTAVVGKMAPKRLKKAGVLTLDGHARFVKLADGTVTIYESADADKADEKLVIFRAPIQYIKVKGRAAARESYDASRGAF